MTHRKHLHLGRPLAWLLASTLIALGARAQEPAPPTLEEDLAQIEKRPGSASMDLVERLVESQSDDAGRALLDQYGDLGSLGARLVALEGFAAFADHPDLGEESAGRLRDVATTSSELELREAALRALATAGVPGRRTLAEIVESPVNDEVRLLAIELHTERSQPADDDFYRRLWLGRRPVEEDAEEQRRTKGDEAPVERPRAIAEISRRAFVAVARRLSDDELLSALGSWSATIRREALRQLLDRDHESAIPAAQRMFENRGEFGENRSLAAEALLEHDAEEWLELVVEEGGRRDANYSSREGMAALVARFGNDDVYDDLVRNLTRGAETEQVFRVLALTDFRSPKYQRKLEKLLKDKSTALRFAVIDTLGRRRDPDSAEALDKVLQKSKDAKEIAKLTHALSLIHGDDDEWRERLLEMARAERQSERNAALSDVAALGGDGVFELLEESASHPDWSTRRIAIGALAESGTPAAVGVLVSRVEFEAGRIAADLEEFLWSLTGKPFGRNARAWASWWEREGADFEPIGRVELAKLKAERERRRLEESSLAPEFFGLRIVSHSVTFVIDVSGSMEEKTMTAFEGVNGPPRFDVATQEVRRAIERLDPGASFNLLAFSSDVYPWSDRLKPASRESKQEALEFLDGLRATGGTNLFAALQEAFADPEMDSLIVLSDGEPSVGDVVNPEALRRVIRSWNEDRGVRIHTVQIGSQLPILSWLSEDSGGSAVSIP